TERSPLSPCRAGTPFRIDPARAAHSVRPFLLKGGAIAFESATIAQYGTSRFLRWVPGLVTASLHSPGTRGFVSRTSERASASEDPGPRGHAKTAKAFRITKCIVRA